MKQRSEASSNRIDNFYASGGSARGKFINSRSDEMSWSLLSLFFIFADTSKLNLRRFVLLCFAVGNQNEWVFIGSPSHDRLSLIIYFVFCIDFTCAINIIRQLEIEIIQRFLLSPHLALPHFRSHSFACLLRCKCYFHLWARRPISTAKFFSYLLFTNLIYLLAILRS